MNTETNNLTAERSLEIIKKSIDDNRKEMINNTSGILIWWGALVTITALICWYFTRGEQDNGWIHLSWFVMAVLGFAGERMFKAKNAPHAVNFVERTVGAIWLSFCAFALGMGVVASVSAQLDTTFSPAVFSVAIYPVILLLMSMACTITGFVLQSKLISTCGILGGLISMAEIYFIFDETGMLVLAVVALIELVLPGIIINAQRNK